MGEHSDKLSHVPTHRDIWITNIKHSHLHFIYIHTHDLLKVHNYSACYTDPSIDQIYSPISSVVFYCHYVKVLLNDQSCCLIRARFEFKAYSGTLVYALDTCCSHFLTIIADMDLHFRHESELPVCQTRGLNPGRRGARRSC